MNRKPVKVTVEYSSRGKRVIKTLPDAYTARRFYAAKHKDGAEPKIVAAVQ